jgi:hypothetical protein
MKKIKSDSKVKNGEKYGVLSVKANWIESHHRSLAAAQRQATKRNNHWRGHKSGRTFIVVELVQ